MGWLADNSFIYILIKCIGHLLYARVCAKGFMYLYIHNIVYYLCYNMFVTYRFI